MVEGRYIPPRWFAGLLVLALAAAWAFAPGERIIATTQSASAGQVCHITGPLSLSYDEAARNPEGWDCVSQYPQWREEREIVRHDLRAQQADPRFLLFDRQPFSRLEIAVSDAAGNLARAVYSEADVVVADTGMRGFVALPEISGPITQMVIIADGTHYPEAFVTAEILPEAPARPVAGMTQLLAALLCGLLIAPVFFDLGFARTLREAFPLFHALFCFAASVQTAVISGLVPLVMPMSLASERLIGVLSFDLMLIAILLFVRGFLERSALLPWHRTLLLAAAAMPIAATLLDRFSRAFLSDALVYNLMITLYAAMIAALCLVLFVATRRGSRAVRYVILALLPLLLIGIARVAEGLTSGLLMDFSQVWAQNFALLFEVVVTSFAVADRFLTIKQERDSAVTEARSLESLSERDALTGLLNRRALEARFPALRAEGFTAIAIVDLDHFKIVNDTYGHQVGDEVLKTAARALMTHEDEDLLAFRIGGEEFLLLLRGRAMQARAEERRRAITEAVAKHTDIERQVTASAGYLEASTGALTNATFDSLYERADRLLYEAKAHGRDRMVVEKVKVFQRRKAERRAA